MIEQIRPRLVTPLPVYERKTSFGEEGRVIDKLVRLAPGGARAEWVMPGVEGTFRSIKAARAAARRSS